MSDPVLDALAESARNRGLKLVRSRVRTPGKRRFGKAGLTDASGKAVFGMDPKGPNAKPEEVETYLRNLGAGDWGASLDAPARKRKTHPKPRKVAEPSPPDRQERRPAPPPAEPKLAIRPARPGDSGVLVGLIALLDHQVDEAGVRKRIAELARAKLTPLVATLDRQIVGLCGIDAMVAVHRDRPAGRINILVVSEAARGRGIGRKLVAAAEDALRARACRLVEVTSNDRLAEAHAFYRHMGYERTSIRFCKKL
ncbi:GNAT family N-acetyltransferase [Sphingomonas sp.]|uniref:GNAT family N-acetyltransferase n=1 Tax=Sphingomonas sp. TaxID=28214 RepID=UPI0025D53E5F|nr:GNAT family N-acetyltransferase [Sphingomonas sp.]MBV9527200.1 GNAT family N-acetyltransferase [Sphingomonas sp.]